MTRAALSINHVNKSFADPHRPGARREILNDVSLTIGPGEFISIVGSSGCGKSTLLRMVLGLDTDYQGTISLGGKAITGPGLERGIVFQDNRLFPWLNVEQNIAVGLKNAPLSAAEKARRVDEHLALVGLQGFAHAWPHEISGGMAQRVAIARALVNQPQVLLLDEPLGALDAFTRQRLQGELQSLWQRENITMILVTHDVDEAVWLSDRVVVMAANPGHIRRIVEIDLPRPRNRSQADFLALRDDILSDFIPQYA
ncbi:ABC transporter ATP-binding protein [Shimwellia blattae]|uniref:Putative ABC transporter n=1 Tax=Shimwellia blattae (strain ATCC 29907 / DSM 4481 / JCM 1650 / NBRC 105725 / CDC 9005-74) TaxID=630626 RepID=I2B651_SHIBC|nr:ABC transporter ATP-binding protein [Shimwellia blattae]AFJ46005.1 putative ABC transporter [Shimwellia blattae DSM 4481 = NBRC 105725]GAB82716.1 aliphatic sulfonate ABC transporter ATP-binding protein [Shimwellia blattae DSM 4481 = NBRC 105725]VDY63481.1 Aliphatic sulfonates import ATP-binding protein SsuB [Shimwellia blattae]VEC21419.1 Aliphatic sulfonates import ATP-binding protein SsuB [Shimwellia blattae]